MLEFLKLFRDTHSSSYLCMCGTVILIAIDLLSFPLFGNMSTDAAVGGLIN